MLVTASMLSAGLAGCGGESERDRVETYIARANEVQRGFEKDFKSANDTYQAFARSTMAPEAAVRRLRDAALAIVHARGALEELDPPGKANELHSRLLRVFDMNEDFAVETLRLARYQRASSEILEPLGATDTRLRRELRSAKDPEAQARALDRFADGFGRVIARLRALEVPRVLGPPHRTQVARLQRTRTLARRLERALGARDAQRVARLVKEFRRPPSGSRWRKRLAQQAIREYERRYRQLSDAYGDLRRQNGALGRTLG